MTRGDEITIATRARDDRLLAWSRGDCYVGAASMVLLGELASIGSALTWALANIVYVRLTARQSPLALNTVKCTLALVMLVLTMVALDGALWPAGLARDAFSGLAISGLVGITVGDTLYFAALERIGARRAVLLSALVPPASALVAWIAFGEVMTAVKLGGMALTLGGVVLVMRERLGSEREGEEDRTRVRHGLALGVAAVICQVAANVLTKDASGAMSALGISVVRLAAGTVGLLVVVLVRGRGREVVQPFANRRSATQLVLATVLGTYLGIWLYMAGLRYADVGVAVTLSATGPIFVLPLSRFVLGEPWSVRSISGALVATAGVALLLLL